MAVSPEDGELINQALSNVQGLDWQEASAAIVRSKMIQDEAHDKPTEDPEARIAFTGRIVSEVVANPKELVVFHRFNPREPEYSDTPFRHFNIIAVNPSRPFEVAAHSKDSRDSDTWGWSLRLNQGMMPSPYGRHQEIPTSRVIAYVDGGGDEYSHFDAHGGVRSEDVTPDTYYRKYDPINYDIAVGAKQVGALFDRLHGQALRKQHLFGALLHVGLLAEELGAELPVVTAFGEEIASGTAWLEAMLDQSNLILASNRLVVTQAKKFLDTLKSARGITAEAADALREEVAIPGAAPLIIHDRDIDDVSAVSGGQSSVEGVITRCEAETKEHGKRLERLIVFEKIVKRLDANAL